VAAHKSSLSTPPPSPLNFGWRGASQLSGQAYSSARIMQATALIEFMRRRHHCHAQKFLVGVETVKTLFSLVDKDIHNSQVHPSERNVVSEREKNDEILGEVAGTIGACKVAVYRSKLGTKIL